MGMPALIGSDVVILTRSEYDERQRVAFLRGVERGKFEAHSASPGSMATLPGAVVRTETVEDASAGRPTNSQ